VLYKRGQLFVFPCLFSIFYLFVCEENPGPHTLTHLATHGPFQSSDSPDHRTTILKEGHDVFAVVGIGSNPTPLAHREKGRLGDRTGGFCPALAGRSVWVLGYNDFNNLNK
jgi:hypothetical protein